MFTQQINPLFLLIWDPYATISLQSEQPNFKLQPQNTDLSHHIWHKIRHISNNVKSVCNLNSYFIRFFLSLLWDMCNNSAPEEPRHDKPECQQCVKLVIRKSWMKCESVKRITSLPLHLWLWLRSQCFTKRLYSSCAFFFLASYVLLWFSDKTVGWFCWINVKNWSIGGSIHYY